MRKATVEHVRLGGQRLAYRLISSPAARKLRVRVGPTGVDVVQPKGRSSEDVIAFLRSNEKWILGQLHRAEQLSRISSPRASKSRGDPLSRRVDTSAN